MRKINKIPCPKFVNHLSRNKLNKFNIWNKLDLNIKQKTRDYILKEEQKGLSAYTEKRIEKSKKLHIDHFHKRDLYPQQTFDWDNLLVDEKEKPYGADAKDKKILKCDYKWVINPVVDDPHQYFEYSANGEIIPKIGLGKYEKKRAEKTIEIFNLNHSSLVDYRKTQYKHIHDYLDAGLPKQDILSELAEAPFLSLTEFLLP